MPRDAIAATATPWLQHKHQVCNVHVRSLGASSLGDRWRREKSDKIDCVVHTFGQSVIGDGLTTSRACHHHHLPSPPAASHHLLTCHALTAAAAVAE
jgi:hypothetical protein